MSYLRQSKPKNALCSWCDQFDIKDRFCYSKQAVIHDWTLPRRCSRYQGPALEGEAYNKLMETQK